MNEQIKLLALQAGLQPFEDCGQGYVYKMEKFAELIITECIDEIKHLRMNYDTHRDVEPVENDWYIDAFLQAEVRLKEHFGVKE